MDNKAFLRVERIITKVMIVPLYTIGSTVLTLSIFKDSSVDTSVMGMNDLFQAVSTILISVMWKRWSDKIFKSIRIANAISTVIDVTMVILFYKGIVSPTTFLLYSSSCLILLSVAMQNSYNRIKYIVFSGKELENFDNFSNVLTEVAIMTSSLILIFVPIEKSSAAWLFLTATLADSIIGHVFFTKFKGVEYKKEAD